MLPYEVAEAAGHLELAYGLLNPGVALSDMLLGLPGVTPVAQVGQVTLPEVQNDQ
jgi:hypothetical protein